ncbi:MAG: DUF2155 domain-containing protein [Rickettsiales bacterium]|jgi:hypothetical protein|nr:DUF2155 domain-containing protein [Rickettsiales bacterium]
MKKNSFLIFLFVLNVSFADNMPLKIKNVKEENKASIVKILALDKITSRNYKYEIKINEGMQFERIKITPLFCWKSSPEEFTENKALIMVEGKDLNGEDKQFYYGWLFSSSSSLSKFEHPMYDIKLLDCLK